MINPNIMNLRMELSDAKKKILEEELKVKRLFWELQTFANPYYKSFEEIKAEEILQCAKDMFQVKNNLLELKKRIKSLKNELGED